jgi:manganese-dependent ADP-ribose/CDP-alcohol diphosphatase
LFVFVSLSKRYFLVTMVAVVAVALVFVSLLSGTNSFIPPIVLEHNHTPRLSSTTMAPKQSLGNADESSAPRFTVGLIADIQYAPIPDGYSYAGTPRYYRHSLDTARTAFTHFQQERLPLVINLGDIVDGKCQQIEENGGDPIPVGADPGHYALDDVLEALSVYQHGPVIHAYGNHCLYNLDRPTLQSKLGIPFVREPCGELVGYHSHSYEGFRFLVLDSYDVAKMKRCESSSLKYRKAVEILREKNPNYDKGNENSPSGLKHLDKRFVAFNGAVGPLQLEWIRRELADVRACHEKAIILSHQPILPGSTSPTCLMWNYHDVLDILRDFKDVVTASFSGHAHRGGYLRDEVSGIHFRVVEAALENPNPHKTYAMIDVHEDRLTVRGFGNCKSAEYDFDHLTSCSENQGSRQEVEARTR